MKQVLRFLALAVLLAAPWGGYFNQVQAQTEETVTVAFYPPTEQYATGYTDGTTKTSGDMHCVSAGGVQGWMKFDVSGIPDGATINSITLKFYNTSNSNCWVKLTSAGELDPVTASASDLYAAITTTTPNYYTSAYMSGFSSPGLKSFVLSNDAVANLQTNGLTNDYFTMGFYEYESSSGYNLYASGYEDANKPYIEVTYTATVTCSKPSSLTPSDILAHSAILTWAGGSGTYNVQYKKAADAEWTTLLSNTTLLTTPLSTLDAQTEYQARVQSVCGGEISNWTSTTFTTECEAISTFPWSTNFDSYAGTTSSTTNNLPLCWNYINTSSSNSYPIIYNNSSDAHSGSNYLRFYIYSGSSYADEYAILPEMDGISGLRMKLYARAYSSSNATFHVGVMTDPTDATTFVEIGTYTPTTTTYELYTIPFNTYTGSGNYIAIKVEKPTSSSRYVYIDDITVEVIPNCIEPSALAEVPNTATPNSLTFNWTAGGSETTWKLQYKKSSEEEWTTLASPVTTIPYTLEGLDASTAYNVRVAAWCNPSNPEAISSYSEAATATTACEAFTAPWTENFESLTAGTVPICWNNSSTTGTDYSSNPHYYWGVYEYSSNKMLRMYNFMAHGPNAIINSPTITLPSEGTYQLTFDYSHTASCGAFYVKISTDNGASFVDLQSYTKVGTSSSNSDPGTFTEANPISLADYAGQSIILQFYAEPNYGSGAIFVDNISVGLAPTCNKPTGLAKANVAAHTVDLSWTKGDAETDWDICINDNEDALVSIDESDVTITGSSVSYTLTGLDPETAYTVKVRANCGGGNGVSQWSNVVSFTTTVACPAPTSPSNHDITAHTATLKWIGNAASSNYEVKYRTAAGVDLNTSVLDEDFTGLTAGIPTGWDNSEGTTTTDSYKWNYNSSGNGTGPCVRFNSYNNSNGKTNFLKTPAMDFPAGETMTLTFWWKNPAGDDFSVYISTDGGTTKTPLKTGMTGQSSWKQESISLSDYVGATNVTIHFKGTSNCGYGDAYIYLDDIVIGEEIPAGEWQTVAPANITVTPGTYVGAASLSGLLAETKYEAYVRTDCNAAGDGYSTTQLDFTPFTTDIACKKPTTLAADATGATTVTLSWTNGEEGQNAWQICINGDEEHLVAANANPFTVEGLTPATTYSFKVRANCTAADDGYSDWSDPLEDVETQAACPTPVLAANGITNITDNSATVTWTGFAENQDFTVSYRTAATMGNPIFNEDFSSGIGEWTMSDCNVSTGVNDETFRFKWTTTPPQYLISPEISGIDAEVILEFQYKDANYTELFQVGYSTTDNNVSSFTFGTEIATPSDQTWHTYHGTLPAGTKYISIKCNSDDQYYLYVDNIVIASEVAAGAWQTVSPNPTTTTTTLTGLTPETKYDVKVQANCALSQTSGESEVRSFTTYYGATLDVTANSWYAIASPVHNSGNNETVAGVDNLIATSPVEYDFLRYNEQNAKWESQKDDGFDAMERGRGHIYRRSAATTLKFIGERNTGNITYFCYGASSGTMKGWNLIGNPYPHEITRAHISQAYGYLVDGYYTLQASGIWRAEASTTAPIAVGQAILVKVTSGGNVTFSETAPATKSAPASTIAFTVSNDEFTDIAYARFSSEEGLPKISHLNPEAPMLSIDGYAIANLNEGTESFPMSFSGQGSYTLTVSGNTDVTGYLHLVDRLTGRDIDLLSTPSYSFTGSSVSDRFTVKLTPDDNEGLSTSRFAIFDGNSLVINGEGTLEVYDVMGRRLMSAEVTGSEYRIPGSDLHTGVYVLRMNGNSQKIVIK